MDFRFSRPMRLLSTVTLAFFLWTFGGIYEVAFAATRTQSSEYRSQTKAKKAEEKFEKTLEDIEQVLADTVTDTDTKKEKLKTKKAEIEAYDIEIRKQFEETERKLKEAGLPGEILQRHEEFVRKYEESIKELKAHLDAIERAKGKAEVEAEVEKAKAFLEKVKPPKKHVPLDPNKLPHRTAEPTEKKPRLKKEEFGPQSTQRAQREDSRQYAVGSKQGIKDSRQYGVDSKQEPILVASAGSLSGLLDSPLPTTYNPQPVLLAQADPPTDTDLTETIEVQFTPAIQAKAAELGNNPVKIYNWVRNNIEFVPTYGSIQGADMCLQTKQCNAFDTASLLIALLRASNIPARYVYGTIELPIEKVMNWVGGFTDPMAAIDFMAGGGIPIAGGLTSGGKIFAARMEHVWVEAWIDYIPSRGARHKTGQGDTWVRLDASFKQYNYTEGIDIKSAVPFDAQSFIDQIQATATINETEGYVTGIDSLFINQTMQDYQTQVENYITQNYPNATVGDVLGKKEIIQKSFPYLLGTLPYKVVVTGQKTASISDNLRHKIRFKLIRDIYDDFSDTFMDITKSLPELAGKKITLSYSPATPEDEAVINSYIPEPGPDGTIDPSELPTSLPAYLINLRPELRVDGEVVATGTVVGLGVDEEFTMTFTAPNKYASKIPNEITSGGYYAMAIDPVRISEGHMQGLKTKLEATKAKLEAQDFTGLTKDDILGDLLYTTALAYFAEMDAMDYVTAKTMGIVNVRLPSLAIFSYELNTTYIFGFPMYVSAGGLAMDIDRDVTITEPLDGDNDKKVQFVIASGMNGSALEHSVPEQMFSTPENPAEGISAVKALQIANDQGIPIYTIDQSNIDTVLPQLQVSSTVKTNIQNAVNAGMVATVPKTNITFNGWTGVGYIIINPATGAGAYIIGGLSGGILLITLLSFLIPLIFLILTFTGLPMLVIGGGLLIWSMWRYIDKINEYIDKMEKGIVTPERAEALIIARSVGTIIANILSLLGKDSPFKLFGTTLIAVFQLIMDGIEALFEEVSSW